MTKLRIAMVAGEASGDILGAGLIQAIKKRYPHAVFYGIGGDLMCAQGFDSVVPMDKLSVMGLVEVLGRLPELLSIRKKLSNSLIDNPPDLFVGIDAPDFNLKLEHQLKAVGIATVHYVSPSVWAWKKKRIYKIKESTDLVLALFPFEAQHYKPTKQNVVFVGHPLADLIANDSRLLEARAHFDIADTTKVIALLPGSRGSELKYLAEPFLQAAELLQKKYPDILFLLPAANTKRKESLKELLGEKFSGLNVRLLLNQSRESMAAADAILIASGTATLEATLLKKPMVVVYKMASLTYAIYSRMIKTPYISLPNILAGEKLVPEVLQGDVTPARLAAELEKTLQDKAYQALLDKRFTEINQQLKLDADERAADAVISLLQQRGILTCNQ
ncbi:lipid-A-disaccharide synthase [Neptunomonas japonica]|uniref:lipid-A-disaccharide synthase n=1 Tax=Neptunomonas japonica TaxID=417574 RepID=UPI000419AA64|nr:lipid-A-disaccharide synthase [Neptunomonas japonica]